MTTGQAMLLFSVPVMFLLLGGAMYAVAHLETRRFDRGRSKNVPAE